ncbi:MAG: M48 family metallopeptidase [Bacteroidetes bacterium]|nr:M48 family metallopeptidase [Bacteroidota bacterium]
MSLLFGRNNKTDQPVFPKVLHYDHLPVPVLLYIERRSNSRISLLKDKIHIRLPAGMPAATRETELNKLIAWARLRISKKGLYDRESVSRDFFSDPVVRLKDIEWNLEYMESLESDAFSAKLGEDHGSIIITGPFSQYNKQELSEMIKNLTSRVLSRHYIEMIIEHVSAINDKTFKFRYNTVRLKYMTSRWGSCSSKRNINLSLRILMLPDRVRDYIIVHELAHLSEMNHSPKFWQLVAEHVPDYKQSKKWLKENGNKYDL